MKNAERMLVASLKRYAVSRGIELQMLSGDWAASLTKAGRRHLVFGYDLGLNSSAASRIASDKGATYDVLTASGLPALEHRVFMHPRFLDFMPADGNWPAMLETFARFGRDAVIKDNEGTGGLDVYRVGSLTQLEQKAQQLFQIARAVALSPFVTIEEETRFVMIEQGCVLAYAKERAPGSSEWRHNLGLGAKARRLDAGAPELAARLTLAREAMAALTLRFASIDVITVKGAPMVLEANGGVMLEVASGPDFGGAGLADRIYGQALDLALRDQ